MSSVYDILCEHGFHVVGATEIVAQHSCLIDRSTNVFTNERIEKIIDYVESSFKKHQGITVQKHKEALGIRLLCAIPNSGILKKVTDMEFENEQCRYCNACVKICPTRARISPEKVSEKKCIRCFACMTICPQHAIQIKTKKIAKIALMHHQKEIHTDIYL